MNTKNTNTHIPTMLGVKETARCFGVAEYCIRQLALSGAVKAFRTGKGRNGKILVNVESVADYFDSVYITVSTPAPTIGIQPISANLERKVRA